MFSNLHDEQNKVANCPPTLKAPYRIAIIGDAPGFDDLQVGKPFSGQAGNLLSQCLLGVKLSKSGCFIGNISQTVPPSHQAGRLKWDGEEIQQGMRELRKELLEFKPNLVILLGNIAFKAAVDPDLVHPLVPAKFRRKVRQERGSTFKCLNPSSPFYTFKCMAAFHPLDIFKEYQQLVLFQFDLRRAALEGTYPEVTHPKRELIIRPSLDYILSKLEGYNSDTLVSIDIEGGIVSEKKSRRKDPETGDYINDYTPSCVPCLAISTDPTEAYIINFGSFTTYEERLILTALSRMCFDSSIPKLFQNGVYDTFVMWKMFRILVRNHRHDTMLSGWELYPELPKAIGVQASIYTNEPFWKADRKTDDYDTFLRYCCKDAAVTLEIHQKQMAVMSPAQREHYEFNVRLLPILLYAELRGIHWDKEAAQVKASDLQAMMREPWARMQTVAKNAGIPEHNKQKGVYFNPNISQGAWAMTKLLYGKLGYPPQYRIENGRKTSSLTADKLSLLNLLKKFPSDTLIADILLWRKLKKLLEQASIKVGSDSRVRCSYNPVGTDTGRLSSSTAPTGTGMNLQTLTKPLRALCVADPGYYFFQIDLEGADGWTVACRCKELAKDDTMLLDYQYGIKPAWVIAMSYMVNSVEDRYLLNDEVKEYTTNLMHWPREVIKAAASRFFSKSADPAMIARFEWLYFASKRVQHGSNYGLGKIQMSNQIIQDSYKLAPAPIYLPPKDCDRLKQLYLRGRYMAVQKWQTWVKSELLNKGQLPSASGHIRRFFGRRNDASTFNSALSHEPQHNTTYVTNLGLQALWHDKENYREDGTIIIEPLHQVHDAMCGQFPIELETWAVKKLRSYMNNPITIAGTELVIPYEGEYGPSWYDMNKGEILMEK